MSPFDRAPTTSYSTLLETICVYLVPFLVIASYLSKVAYFSLPHLHLSPSLGVSRSNFAETFGTVKLESLAVVWHCLHDSAFSRFYTIPACDRLTDGRTDTRRRLIPRASIASRGNKP